MIVSAKDNDEVGVYLCLVFVALHIDHNQYLETKLTFFLWCLIRSCNNDDDDDDDIVLAQILEVPLPEDAYHNNPDIKVECGGTSTTASGGWSLGYINGKSCGETAATWLTNYFARFPSTRVGANTETK